MMYKKNPSDDNNPDPQTENDPLQQNVENNDLMEIQEHTASGIINKSAL